MVPVRQLIVHSNTQFITVCSCLWLIKHLVGTQVHLARQRAVAQHVIRFSKCIHPGHWLSFHRLSLTSLPPEVECLMAENPPEPPAHRKRLQMSCPLHIRYTTERVVLGKWKTTKRFFDCKRNKTLWLLEVQGYSLVSWQSEENNEKQFPCFSGAPLSCYRAKCLSSTGTWRFFFLKQI